MKESTYLTKIKGVLDVSQDLPISGLGTDHRNTAQQLAIGGHARSPDPSMERHALILLGPPPGLAEVGGEGGLVGYFRNLYELRQERIFSVLVCLPIHPQVICQHPTELAPALLTQVTAPNLLVTPSVVGVLNSGREAPDLALADVAGPTVPLGRRPHSYLIFLFTVYLPRSGFPPSCFKP